LQSSLSMPKRCHLWVELPASYPPDRDAAAKKFN
jgi:hypothetical protein